MPDGQIIKNLQGELYKNMKVLEINRIRIKEITTKVQQKYY